MMFPKFGNGQVMFPKYGKVETLFVRDPETFKVMVGHYRRPEFGVIESWDVTEKIDGTNVRVHWSPHGHSGIDLGGDPAVNGLVKFGGRTDNAQMPFFLLDLLVDAFTPAAFVHAFPDGDAQITLFGEGYGGKIQKGGNYRKDASFRLFDVLVHGCEHHRPIWLKQEDVVDVADKLGIGWAPYLGRMPTLHVVELAKAGRSSEVAYQERGNMDYKMEGVVARAPHGLLNRLGGRVMFKLKYKDFA